MNKLILFFIIIFYSAGFAQEKEIVAYFPQWGVEHQPYFIKNIETSGAADKITVINYAFIIPAPDSSGKIVPTLMNDYYDYIQIYTEENSVDGKADSVTQKLRGHFNQIKRLKAKYPQIRVVVSLGGWTGSIYFSKAARTPESRKLFVEKCIDMFIDGNLPEKNMAGGKGAAKGIFDGFDIDWEFPVSGGAPGIKHHPNDAANLTKLYSLFRTKLDSINPDLLLTAAVPNHHALAKNYNIKQDSKYLDWYLLMTYDYHGSWNDRTGHLTNLYAPADTNENNDIQDSFHKTVKLYRDVYGVPADKIIPGAAFYGRGWKNVEPSGDGKLLNRPGAVADGIYELGFNYYSDLIELIKKGYKLFWDEEAQSPFLYSDEENVFWSLDNERSVRLKTKYARDNDLRGMMFWEISGDDTSGTLVKSIFDALKSGN